jgi:hypothetical protein
MLRSPVFIAASLTLAACVTVAGSSRTIVPFDPHSNQVAIAASANGVPVRMLVDTAVDPSALDKADATAAGLKKLGEDEEVGGVGSDAATAYPSVISNLTIAGHDFGPIEVVVNDMSKLRARYGAPLNGILGYSLLKNHAVLIDYKANFITFFDGAAPAPRGCRQAHRFPLRFRSEEDKTILVPGLRIGGVEVPAFLDTGSSNGLRIDADSTVVAPIVPILPKGEAGTSVGARGEAPVERGTLRVPIALGPFRLSEIPVSIVHEEQHVKEVNIGNQFLRALGVKLLVDIPGGKVGLYGECEA